MAGTVVTTEITFASVKQVTFDWLGDGAGAADATTTAAGGYTGQLAEVRFIPDGGATAPDDLYDVAVNDSAGYDLLNGLGANLSGVNTVVVQNQLSLVVASQLTLAVTNSGAANGGIVIVKIW